MSIPRESEIEKYLVRRCRELDLLCFKFTSPSQRAVPDRLLVGHDAQGTPITAFVEVKRPGEKPRPDQGAMIEKLRRHGALVASVDSPEAIEDFLHRHVIDPRGDRSCPAVAAHSAHLLILDQR